MTTEQLKNWIKSQDPDYIGRIQLGGVDGNAERFLGVYPSPNQGPAHIAIGGPACTSYGTLYARLLLRWGKSQPEAEAKANALWGLFYGLTGADMAVRQSLVLIRARPLCPWGEAQTAYSSMQ